MNNERATTSNYVGMVWQWLRKHARPLQALAAIAGIAFGLIMIIDRCSSNRSEPRKVCVEFETYADNTEFGDNVKLNSIVFQSRHPTGRLFVNQSGRVKALQFMDQGLTVDFPSFARMVEIKLADFFTPIKLEILGDNNRILESRVVDRDNSTELSIIKKNSFSIYKIILSGGGNEGGLESICAELER